MQGCGGIHWLGTVALSRPALSQRPNRWLMVLVMYGMVLVGMFLAVAVAALKDAHLVKTGRNKSGLE